MGQAGNFRTLLRTNLLIQPLRTINKSSHVGDEVIKAVNLKIKFWKETPCSSLNRTNIHNNLLLLHLWHDSYVGKKKKAFHVDGRKITFILKERGSRFFRNYIILQGVSCWQVLCLSPGLYVTLRHRLLNDLPPHGETY